MVEITEKNWYNLYGESMITIKVKDATVHEIMQLKGIASRANKEIREVLESNKGVLAYVAKDPFGEYAAKGENQ